MPHLNRQELEAGKWRVTWNGADVTGYCREASTEGGDNYVQLYHLTRRGQIKPNSWYVRYGDVEITKAVP